MRRAFFIGCLYLGLMFLPPPDVSLIEAAPKFIKKVSQSQPKRKPKRKRKRKRKPRAIQYPKPPHIVAVPDVVEVYTYEEWQERERVIRELSRLRWPMLATANRKGR